MCKGTCHVVCQKGKSASAHPENGQVRVPGIGIAVNEGVKAMKYLSIVIMVALLTLPVRAQQKEEQRDQNARTVMKEILNVPDDIPQQLLDKAERVIVLPSVLKFAFISGDDYGRGVMTCRTSKEFSGPWGASTMMVLEGGSFGFRLRGQATDFVLLVVNPRGADSILSSKVKLGAGVSAPASPKGRCALAASDAALRAVVLSNSRSRGLFAGAYLEGSTLQPDNDANKRLYDRRIAAKDVALRGKVPVALAANELVSELNQRSPKNLSN